MNNAAAGLAIATTLLTSPSAEAGDRVGAGMAISSTTAALIASAQGYSPGYGRAPYAGAAPAIFGYGWRATYYGNGYSYQPAFQHMYYVAPRLYGCCRW
jgi:hypothetical protein